MPNKIETELLEATGLKKKRDEEFQEYADRLIEAVHDLKEDDWEALSEDAQDWVNKAAKQRNANKTMSRFPADEEPEEAEPEEEAAEEAGEGEPEDEPKPARGGRRRAAEPEDEGEAEGEPEESPEETKPARGGRRAAVAEAEEEPKSRARTGRRAPKEEPEEPAPRTRGARTARASSREDEEDRKPAKPLAKALAKAQAKAPAKKEPAKPAARSRKEPEGKAASATTLLKKMLIKNPKMSTDDILAELDEKHDLQPTKMAIASIRSAFIHSMRVLNDAGHLSDKMADRLP